MVKHKKQHFIPQCYLRLFSDDNKHIWTYDKEKAKSYGSTISDVCTINDFYTISEKTVIDNEQLTQFAIEKDFFAKEYEPEYARMLIKINDLAKEAIKNASNTVLLGPVEKYDFASLVVIQWLRLPLIRYDNESTFDEIMPKMLRLFSQGLAKEKNNPELTKLNIISSITDRSVFHAKNTFLNDDLVATYASSLSNNIWTFSYSTDGNFFSSDFPITVNPHVHNVRPMCQGLAQYGAELTFPISKNLVLTIWDKEYFQHKSEDDCFIAISTSKEIRAFNAIRYMFAQRHLFCSQNDFEYVNFMSLLNPMTLNPFKK